MRLRYGMIGAGVVAPLHLQGIAALDDAELVGISALHHDGAAAPLYVSNGTLVPRCTTRAPSLRGLFSGGNLLSARGVSRTTLVERTAMRRYLIAAAVVALLVPAVAAAKGPVSATISGPRLDRSLAIHGDGEGPGTALGTLAAASGYFAQMFGQSPDPTLASRPRAILGPRYKAVYIVPGPNDVQSRVVQYIYPYAKPVALTFMKPGQRFWNGRKAHGGWYRASTRLKAVLVRAGLPAAAP